MFSSLEKWQSPWQENLISPWRIVPRLARETAQALSCFMSWNLEDVLITYQAKGVANLGSVAWRAATLFQIVYAHPGFVVYGASELVSTRSWLPRHFKTRCLAGIFNHIMNYVHGYFEHRSAAFGATCRVFVSEGHNKKSRFELSTLRQQEVNNQPVSISSTCPKYNHILLFYVCVNL